MRLEETQEQRVLRAELREYFERALTPEVREGLGPHPGEHCGPAYRAFVRRLGEDMAYRSKARYATLVN